MKTIITVIFFGILAYAVATNSQCQNSLQTKQDLNIQNFFTGSWYMTHIKDGSNEAACREYRTEIKEGLLKLNAEGPYTLNGQKKHFTTTCSSTSGKQLNQAGPFELSCRHTYDNNGKQENIFFKLQWSVIETDYQNYALVYRCSKQDAPSTVVAGNLLLLQRSKKADGSIATRSLQQRGLSLQQFRKTPC